MHFSERGKYKLPTELTGIGDAVRGERIAAEASDISQPRIYRRSSAHKGQFITLKFNAYCVIEAPMKWVSDKANKLK